MADIKVFGKNVPKWAVYGGVIGGGGGLIYAYVRSKNKAKAAAAATASNTASTYAYGYGSYAYGSQQYAYGNQYGYGAYGYASGSGDGGIGTNYGYGYYNAGQPQEYSPQATTNAEWSVAAVSALTPQGYTGTQILSALGPYLAGQPISTSQASVVQAAIAVEGYPPVPGQNGDPPGIKTAGTTGGGQTSNVTVPKTVGQPQEAAFAILSEAGLKPKGTPTISGKTLTVQSSNPPAGASVAKGSTVTLTSKVVK
jgi:hypothetical protein